MDFTEKYIKMCEKAEEIQRRWKPVIGDWLCWKIDYEDRLIMIVYDTQKISSALSMLFVVSPFNKYKTALKIKEAIWLPRQDQLQEMILEEEKMTNCLLLTEMFVEFLDKHREWLFESLCSMEQLWLIFVMWELYGKIWDDGKEEWAERSVSDEKGENKD